MQLNIPKSRKAPRVDPSRPEDVMAMIQDKSRLIATQQAKADRGEFRGNYGGAIGLQRLQMDRQMLMGMLEPLRLVGDNDND